MTDTTTLEAPSGSSPRRSGALTAMRLAELQGLASSMGISGTAKMRELISDRGPISSRSDAFATESLALMGVIANLQQTSVAPAVKRAAASLSSGFIAPAAGGRTADLADRQTAVVGKVESSIAAQAASLAEAAEKILATPRVEPARFQAMSPAEAAKDETVLAELQKAVDDANKAVSKAESIRKFEVLDIDFTVESGHLTPSLNLKRNVVMDDYADAVERLYA